MFRLTDLGVSTLAFFRKPLVFCESGFRKPLHKATGGFQLAGHDTEYTFSLISGLPRVFTYITGLLKHEKSFLYLVSVRISIISKYFHRSSLKLYI
jgi:hypothetical protein